MPNSFFTIDQLITLNDKNANDLGVSDLLNKAPFLKVLHATKASNGTVHTYLKQTGAPTVGFRVINKGRFNSTSTYQAVSESLEILDASFLVDIAAADSYKDGPDAFLAREATSSLQQALFVAEKQMWYGATSGGDVNGFIGLGDNSGYNGASDTMVVNALGTTANTASSCWLIRTTDDDKNMSIVLGNEGEITIGQTVITPKMDDSTDEYGAPSFAAYYTPILGYVGLQVGSAFSAARIANLTADSGKGLTDALISQGMSLFPAGAGPTHIVMSRRSLQQLQKSRTATNPTGAPAPFPQDSFGVQIVVTDSIVNTEAILS